MINGPSDVELVGTGGAGAEGASLGSTGAPVGGVGTPVGEGSTFVIAYDVLKEASSLETSTEDEATALEEGVGVASALDVGTEVEAMAVDTADDVAFAENESDTEDLTTCEDVNGPEDAAGVSAGAVSVGKTVVYCVTMITGGTCNDVDGRSSAEGDSTTDVRMEEELGTAGTAAMTELEIGAEGANALDISVESNEMLAEDRASDAVAMGKTVVYSVFVTTRPDEVTTVGVKGVELGARLEDSADLTGADEGVAIDNDAATEELIPEELIKALLMVAEPWTAPGWVKPGIPVPFCAGRPPTAD